MFLEVHQLSKHFMGVVALDKVSISLERGEIVGLIGPNGSGKTTLFNCITGFIKPDEGRVIYEGQDITGRRADKIALQGLVRTFQIVRIFPCLTVLENMLVAIQQHQEDNILRRITWSANTRRYEEHAKLRAMELLAFVGLDHMRDQPASNLSYGQRKLLDFAAVLMPDPKLLFLDEPTAAVNPVVINQLRDYLKAINSEGKTILLIEHNMEVIMDLCPRIIVLDEGHKIAEGSPDEIKANDRVTEAYFGR